MHRKGKGFGRGEALKGLWRNEKRDIEKGEKKRDIEGKRAFLEQTHGVCQNYLPFLAATKIRILRRTENFD